jgi:hypothetical protein
MWRPWLTMATTKNASECRENVIGGEFGQMAPRLLNW